VGIIGAGRLGQAMARTALRAGRRVVIANSRSPESLASVVSELGNGVSAATGENVERARRRPGRRRTRRESRQHAPRRRARHRPARGRRPAGIFLSGDDSDAKAEVAKLFEEAGFSAIDLGYLDTGGAMQQIRGPLAGVNLIRLAEAD
jgi:predicted dinucleotide-binding enzyme